MEFRDETLQKEMIEDTYDESKKFSSDLVEFFMRFNNGTAYVGPVDLYFERQTMQAKRAAGHDCVFYSIQEG